MVMLDIKKLIASIWYNDSQRISLIVAVIIWIVWSAAMFLSGHWNIFVDNYPIAVTMVVASFIGSATGVGGGAVAFPVLTLLYHISPKVARDFSFVIQSIGMGAASVVILYSRIPIERLTLLLYGCGSLAGIPLGIYFSTSLPPPFVKMFFLSIWLSFAVALFWINRNSNREIYHRIMNRSLIIKIDLIIAGFLGGIITGMTGCGVNIVILMLLLLSLKVSEKIAVPTAVILTALNSIAGVFWSYFLGYQIASQAWNFWWVSIPIVVIGAPAGARFAKSCSRLSIVYFICTVITAEFFTGLFLIRQTTQLLIFALSVFSCGLLMFFWMVYRGKKSNLIKMSNCRINI